MAAMNRPPSDEPLDTNRLLASGLVAAVETFESLGSTHDLAHQRAREQGVRLPLLIAAEQQTAGRGRGQNRWWTGRGSLAFSIVFDPADWRLSDELPPQRSLAVGVAIVDTLAPLVPERRVGLHWPNDVVVDGRKVAGVLVDVLADGRHVVGIGINVNNALAGAPAEVVARAASLCELAGHPFDRTEVLVSLLGALRESLAQGAAHPAEFGRRFGELCQQVGRPLTILVAGRKTSGRCAGIAPDGGLVLETPAGLETFYSGALVHPAAD